MVCVCWCCFIVQQGLRAESTEGREATCSLLCLFSKQMLHMTGLEKERDREKERSEEHTSELQSR